MLKWAFQEAKKALISVNSGIQDRLAFCAVLFSALSWPIIATNLGSQKWSMEDSTSLAPPAQVTARDLGPIYLTKPRPLTITATWPRSRKGYLPFIVALGLASKLTWSKPCELSVSNHS